MVPLFGPLATLYIIYVILPFCFIVSDNRLTSILKDIIKHMGASVYNTLVIGILYSDIEKSVLNNF